MAAVLKRAAILLLIGVTSIASAVDTLPASGELDCDDLRLERCEFYDPASGLSVRLPRDWPMRRLRVSTETGPPASVRQPYAERWVVIDYIPEEPANPEVLRLAAKYESDLALVRDAAQRDPRLVASVIKNWIANDNR